MKELLFSYGTLQKETVQTALFGRVLQGWSDTLSGYKIAAIEITDTVFLSGGEQKNQLTAIISKNKTDCVIGKVFEVTAEELLVADKYEPAGFTRIKVTLGSEKEAWLYKAAEPA